MIKIAAIFTILFAFGFVWCPIMSDLADAQFALSEDRFDREQCLDECRVNYGGYGAGLEVAGARSRILNFNTCVMNCERRYWKEFEQESKQSGSK